MIGAILNRKYRVISLIGSGGMAMVYKAVHMSNRRYVAIKVLKEEYTDDREFLRRFSREATAVLNLSHENIVRAYDVGEFNGLPYIVMEYVEGHTLKALIEQNGKLPVRTAIGITADERVCSGAHYARFFADMRRYLDHPELLEEPPVSVRFDEGMEYHEPKPKKA